MNKDVEKQEKTAQGSVQNPINKEKPEQSSPRSVKAAVEINKPRSDVDKGESQQTNVQSSPQKKKMNTGNKPLQDVKETPENEGDPSITTKSKIKPKAQPPSGLTNVVADDKKSIGDSPQEETQLLSNADPKNPVGKREQEKKYNPFGSFDKHVAISKQTIETISSGGKYVAEKLPRRLSSAHRNPLKKRSISVADLTKNDISICFFPEEPDWGDDDDDNDDNRSKDKLSKRIRSDDLFPPDPKTTYDWTQRERWQSRLVYLVAMVTYSVSFNNIYHFPSLVYHYGGIAFLIPYTIFTIIMGYPLHFLASSLGQYSQSGPVRVWDCAPIARGIGWAMFLLCLFVAYYYNMYAAYSFIYFARCFNAVLPWQDCDEPGNPLSNYSCVPRMCTHMDSNQYTPAEHYFFDHVLQINYSGDILSTGLGPMVWNQVLGLFLAWAIVYFAIIQGVRSIGKVVYFLVILPYFILLMLLSAGFMLKGSSRGFFMLFAPKFHKLLDVQVWRAAAEQVFFELRLGQGTPIAYGSFCHHRNPTHIDSAIICFINYCTSILCAVVIFNILGALSLEIGAPVEDMVRQGPAILFITYPEALSRVPGSQYWCVAFFVMLFSVAVATQIAVVQTVMTVVYDEFHNAIPYRWLINLLVCCCLFILGIILCTSNGYFVVHLLDEMSGTMPRLPIEFAVVGTIVLIYGVTKYCEDMHFMINYYPNVYIQICFLLMPVLLLSLIIPSWYLLKPFSIGKRKYTDDAIVVGWFIIWFILIWISLGAIYWFAYCCYTGQLKDIWKSLNSWGPRHHDARIARAEFSSVDVTNFTKPWFSKKKSDASQ